MGAAQVVAAHGHGQDVHGIPMDPSAGASGPASWMPQMVLTVEAVLQRTREAGPAKGVHPLLLCSIVVDGREVGCAVDFPTGPVRIFPESANSRLALRFFGGACAGGSSDLLAEVVMVVSELVQYGAPLFASLWLGLPALCGAPGAPTTCSLRDAILHGRDPEVPKVSVTLYRPVDVRGASSLLPIEATHLLSRPDVKALLEEDIDLCFGPVKRGPSPQDQVQGVLEALRASNSTALALQGALFDILGRGDLHGGSAGLGLTLTWRCDPGVGLAAYVYSQPVLDPASAVAMLQPGEAFRVAQERSGADGVLFLKLADGRGWAAEKTPEGGVLCVRQEFVPPKEEKSRDHSDSVKSLEQHALQCGKQGKVPLSLKGDTETGSTISKATGVPGAQAAARVLQEELVRVKAELERSRAAERDSHEAQRSMERELAQAASELTQLRAKEQKEQAICARSREVRRELGKDAVEEADHLEKKLRDVKSEVAERDSALAQSAKRCNELQELHNRTREELDGLRARHQQEVLRLHAELDVLRAKEQEQLELQEEVLQTSAELEAVRSLMAQHQQLHEDHIVARSELSESKTQVEVYKQERAELIDESCAKQSLLREQQTELTSARGELRKLEAEHERGVAKLRAELAEMAKKEEEHCRARTELYETLSQKEALLEERQGEALKTRTRLAAEEELRRSAQEELDRTRAKLGEVDAELGEQTNQLENVTIQLEASLAREEKQRSAKESLERRLSDSAAEEQARQQEARKQLAEEEERCKDLRARVERLRGDLDEATAKDELHRRAMAKVEEELQAQEALKHELREKFAASQEKLEAALAREASLQSAQAAQEESLSAKDKLLEESRGLLETARTGLREEEERCEELRKELMRARDGLEASATQLDLQEAANRGLDEDLQMARTELRESSEEVQRLRSELEDSIQGQGVQRQASAELGRSLGERDRRCKDLEAKLSAARSELEETQLQEQKDSVGELSARLGAEAERSQGLQSELGALRAQLHDAHMQVGEVQDLQFQLLCARAELDAAKASEAQSPRPQAREVDVDHLQKQRDELYSILRQELHTRPELKAKLAQAGGIAPSSAAASGTTEAGDAITIEAKVRAELEQEHQRERAVFEAQLRASQSRQQELQQQLTKADSDLQEAEASRVILKKAVQTAEQMQQDAEARLQRVLGN